MVDASYTVYLVHLLLVFGMEWFLSLTNLPGVLKFLLIVLTVVVISLAVHHLLVRRFGIFQFAFNGR